VFTGTCTHCSRRGPSATIGAGIGDSPDRGASAISSEPSLAIASAAGRPDTSAPRPSTAAIGARVDPRRMITDRLSLPLETRDRCRAWAHWGKLIT
jgi:hypothetical protein